jgi:hypothetical protein
VAVDLILQIGSARAMARKAISRKIMGVQTLQKEEKNEIQKEDTGSNNKNRGVHSTIQQTINIILQ